MKESYNKNSYYKVQVVDGNIFEFFTYLSPCVDVGYLFYQIPLAERYEVDFFKLKPN